ncbi:efflux RND transporter periplasmic adaptor subunit [Granulicella sp. 5B5]|uniref:efflux RND transporter periplasmic adaptor subunit n=1 Tax=Granulicella sp. 5B5 TaxID=1617967 RepID=UPI0015F69C2B|nr:efflux RND transporter periplasmic adaptor subunit [Granulicella sp. 5B5]QMV18356.1 efflux RND transporter periplasmic adaptor subunit [Granulicella sp. 5B5]
MLPPDPNAASHPAPEMQYQEHEHRPTQSKAVKVIIWVAVLAAFAAAYILIERHKTIPAPKGGGRHGAIGGTVVLIPAKATSGDIGVYVDAIGTVTPVYTANIINQVPGQVTAVHYAEGQMVSKGTPLVEIDPRPYQATLMEAEGTLQRDQGLLAQAQMDLERYKAAWAKNAIPKQTLDDQEKLVMQDEGTVKIDQGTVQYDQVQLSFCHITSPIAGRVGLRLVDPGNVLAANGTSPLAVVTQIQPITVVFSIPEDSLSIVQPELKKHAKLTVDALDRSNQNSVGTGTLITLDNQIDTTTGTVKARALFSNTNLGLYPNEFVNARLLVNTLHNATLVPTSAIQHNGTTAFVFVIDNGIAHLKNVQEGVADGGKTAVTGINPGDTVADSGFEKLQEGSKVSISSGSGGKSGASSLPAADTTSGSSAP